MPGLLGTPLTSFMAPVKGMGCVFAENAFKRDRQKGSMDRFGRIEQSPGTPARRSSVAFWQRSAAGQKQHFGIVRQMAHLVGRQKEQAHMLLAVGQALRPNRRKFQNPLNPAE